MNGNRNKKLVPICINGNTVMIDPNSIMPDTITTHHGKTLSTGTQVNSPDSSEIGDTYIIWPSGRRGPAFSIGKDDFEVMAIDLLNRRNLSVTKRDMPQSHD